MLSLPFFKPCVSISSFSHPAVTSGLDLSPSGRSSYRQNDELVVSSHPGIHHATRSDVPDGEDYEGGADCSDTTPESLSEVHVARDHTSSNEEIN